jgi:hypothetical protein
MKRLLIVVGLTMLLAAPAAGQFIGMPVWNSPKGGTGFTVNGDFGMPDDADGGGNAFGARGTVGFSKFTVFAGLTNWEPDGNFDAVTSFGGGAAYRIIGGSLMPVSVNLLAGAATGSSDDLPDGITNIVAGAGVSATLPIPGFGLEPYANVTNRWVTTSGDTETGFGATFGANLTMGIFGVHLAYDTFSINDVSRSVFGIGAHVSIKAPI